MKKKFVTNLAFLIGVNLLIKPFWIFGIDRTVQNSVGAVDYGIYYALFNFSFLFNILLDAGITNFNNRNISQNQHLLSKHLSGIIFLRILLAVVYITVSYVFAFLLGYQKEAFYILLILLFNQVIISFILYLRSNLAGLQLFKTDSLISVLDRLLLIVICGALLWGNFKQGPFRIEWFVWSQTIAYLITAAVILLILLKKTKLTRLTWNPAFFIVILKQSYPYAILILLMTFTYRIDAIILERILPDGALQAGIYAQAYRLLDAVAIIAYLFAGLLLPMFSRMLKQKENIESLTKLSFSLIMVPAIIVVAAFSNYNKQLMSLLYLNHTAESSIILPFLLSCFIAMSSSYIFGTLLTANGNLRILNFVALGSLVINITLNLLLIPVYKVLGAAIACMVTQFLSAIFQLLIAVSIFKFTINRKFLFSLAGFSISVFFIFILVKLFAMPWIWSMMIASIICVGFAFLFKIITRQDIFNFSRN